MPHDPRFLATAVEAVLRAGAIQMAHLGTEMNITKKGAIDLVTDVDVEIETMFRQMIATRFPDHDVLAEELETDARATARHRWVFDPIDGTTNYAHGLPIFAPLSRSRSTVAPKLVPSTIQPVKSCSPRRKVAAHR